MEKTILILAANPINADDTRFSQEIDSIREELSRKGSLFRLEHRLATNIDKALKAILENKPAIIHFSGHGDESGIVFEDNNGGFHIIDTQDIADFFGAFSTAGIPIECVVLNACYSEKQAKAISKHISYVIGIHGRISSDIAITFSTAFYQGILHNFSIEHSFSVASVMAEIERKRKKYDYEFIPIIIKGKKLSLKDGEEITSKSDVSRNTKNGREPIDILSDYVFENIVKSKELIQELLTVIEDEKTKNIFVKHLTKLDNSSKKLENLSFSVAVIALIKAGKSTLLNAWLGNEFLPSSNRAETAQVVRIRHNNKYPNGRLTHGKTIVEGVDEIRNYLKERNHNVRENIVSNIDNLFLDAPFIALNNKALGKYKFELLDTPGVNESGLSELNNKIKDLLADTGVIIYLLDYTKLGQNDEADLLNKMKEMRSELITSQDRLFIVVNKIDSASRHSLNPIETQSYVCRLLKEHLGIELFPNRVLLVSASRGLLARVITFGKSSKEQKVDFMKLLDATWEPEDEMPKPEELHAKALTILTKSRIEVLEENILGFIYSKRKSLLLSTMLDELGRFMTECENRIKILDASSVKNRTELSQIINDLNRRLDAIKQGIDKTEEPLNVLKKKAELAISKHLDFDNDAYGKIQLAFENQEKAKEYYPKLVASITRVKHYTIQSKNKEDLLKYLEEINSVISDILSFEMEKRLKDLEKEIYQEYEKAISKLQKIAFSLIQEMDAEFSAAFNVPLKSVSLDLAYPEKENFFQNLKSIGLIEEKGKYKMRYKPLKGWFPWFQRKFVVSSYEINSLQYWKRIGDEIKEMKKLWLDFINDLINTKLLSDMENAKVQITERADDYLQILEESLSTTIKENEKTNVQHTTIQTLLQMQTLLGQNLETFSDMLNDI